MLRRHDRRDGSSISTGLHGPVVVEQFDSTVLLSPSDKMEVMDRDLDLLIRVGPSSQNGNRDIKRKG